MQSKNNIKPSWKSQKDIYEEGLKYVRGRMNGSITSLMTPWTKLNNATVNGLEWGSMTVIGARPGVGKTAICDQIIIESFNLHSLDNHRVLQFQLEMPAKAKVVRSLSTGVKLTYKDLCSVHSALTKEQFNQCIEYARKVVDYPIDVVDSSPTVDEFISIIRDYMNYHSTSKTIEVKGVDGSITTKEIKEYKNTVISLDHSILIKKKFGQNLNDMLFELGEACTYLKRIYPIAFIILSQLNRNIDSPDRNEEGKYGNYILSSDIFGGDYLLQHAETVIGLNCPGKQKIRFYGPERYIIDDDKVLVMHINKCRSGDLGLAFFKTKFENMMVVEIDTPPQNELTLRRH